MSGGRCAPQGPPGPPKVEKVDFYLVLRGNRRLSAGKRVLIGSLTVSCPGLPGELSGDRPLASVDRLEGCPSVNFPSKMGFFADLPREDPSFAGETHVDRVLDCLLLWSTGGALGRSSSWPVDRLEGCPSVNFRKFQLCNHTSHFPACRGANPSKRRTASSSPVCPVPHRAGTGKALVSLGFGLRIIFRTDRLSPGLLPMPEGEWKVIFLNSWT